VLAPSGTKAKAHQKQMFLTLDDYLEALPQSASHLHHILRHPKVQQRVEERLRVVCDTVEAGDDSMYRLSNEKLLQELLRKGKLMVKAGLPASMEERFVTKVLQVPVLSVKNDEGAPDERSEEDAADATNGEQISQDSPESSSVAQASFTSEMSTATSTTSLSETETKPIPTPSTPNTIIHLLRLRTAITFILSSYLPPHLRSTLKKSLSSTKAIDFSPLDAHLSHLAKLRAEAQALRSLSDNISRKRAYEDDEAAEARADKKRKKEEEENKKKAESRALKNLKKADLSGMKRLSNFFQKVPKKS
jgi:Ydr279p protein family (RNase H2 complex component) wHTH domain